MSDEKIIKKVDEAWKDRVEKERQEPLPATGTPQPSPLKPETRKAEEPKPLSPQQPAGHEEEQPPQQEHSEFTFFLSTLSMQAMIALGDIPHPATNQPHLDLEQARYMIDVLAMLQLKTKGNLTPEESELLQNLLYELRMRYVSRLNDVQKQPRPPGVPQ
jgi:hypothetical protein